MNKNSILNYLKISIIFYNEMSNKTEDFHKRDLIQARIFSFEELIKEIESGLFDK